MTSDPTMIADALDAGRREINARLTDIVSRHDVPAPVHDAIRYTLLDGGKRLRPLLCLWTHDALGGKRRGACLDVAAAIECMHTYSLVHDDLPCMDDDDLRRGKASCHREFGEGIAVLTGDALLTLAFEITATLGERWEVDDATAVAVTRVLAHAGGAGGLITGQTLDLQPESMAASLESVDRIHHFKTAALISAAMEAGARMAGAGAAAVRGVAEAGILAGRAFQIIDDVLDVQMDEKTLGKTPGKDAKDGKLTYPAIAGVDAARQRAATLVAEALAGLEPVTAGAGGTRLRGLLELLVRRSR